MKPTRSLLLSLILSVLMIACKDTVQPEQLEQTELFVFHDQNGWVNDVYELEDGSILYNSSLRIDGVHLDTRVIGRYDGKGSKLWELQLEKDPLVYPYGVFSPLADGSFLYSTLNGPRMVRFTKEGEILADNKNPLIGYAVYMSRPYLDQYGNVFVSWLSGTQRKNYISQVDDLGNLITQSRFNNDIWVKDVFLGSIPTYEILAIREDTAVVNITVWPQTPGIGWYPQQFCIKVDLQKDIPFDYLWLTAHHPTQVREIDIEEKFDDDRCLVVDNDVYNVVKGKDFSSNRRFVNGIRGFRVHKFTLDLDSLWTKQYEFDVEEIWVEGTRSTRNGNVMIYGVYIKKTIQHGFYLLIDQEGNIIKEQLNTPASSSIFGFSEAADGSYIFCGRIETTGNGQQAKDWRPVIFRTDQNGDFSF